MPKKKKKSKSTPPPAATPVPQPIDNASASEEVQTELVEVQSELVQVVKIPESTTDTPEKAEDTIKEDTIKPEKPPSDAEVKSIPNGTTIVVKAPWGGDALATIEESYTSPEGESWVCYKPVEPPPEGWSWSKGVMLLELVKIHPDTE
ncbi:MAG: hypothetical protein F6K31_43500 [Symploca sp. SIO2G7]|nr:hypothetical protein [Symploca sp. SIO2G7]